jgi:hypothetical protein
MSYPLPSALRFFYKVMGYPIRCALCPLPFLGGINPFFTFLSVVYISVIFLFAGSPALSQVGLFNPFSILHIPLYLILTLLIVLSIVPLPFFHLFGSNSFPPHLPINPSTHNRFYALTHLRMNDLDPMNQTVRFLVAGFISFVVAVADEYHQSLIPTREASITDVLLDIGGIVLALWLVRQIYKRKATCKNG